MDADIATRFVTTMRSWLTSLPHDLKILYEASTDENLDQKQRELAVGAIIYVISPNDAGADKADFANYADDCVVLRLALREILHKSGEDGEFLRGRFEDFFQSMEGGLADCRAGLGELYPWLETRIGSLTDLVYKGNKVPKYIEDDELSELLYEDGLAFATNYPVDEDKLRDRLKKPSTILEAMQRRRAEIDRKR